MVFGKNGPLDCHNQLTFLLSKSKWEFFSSLPMETACFDVGQRLFLDETAELPWHGMVIPMRGNQMPVCVTRWQHGSKIGFATFI